MKALAWDALSDGVCKIMQNTNAPGRRIHD